MDISLSVSRILRRIIRNFFLGQVESRRDERLVKTISHLYDEIEVLKKKIEEETFKDKLEVLEREASAYLERELPNLLKSKLEDIKGGEEVILSEIRGISSATAKKYLSEINYSELTSDLVENEILNRKKKEESVLNEMISDQMRSAGMLKTVMINLFVIFNIGILIFYIFGDVSNMSAPAASGIIGLYISLATFIFYIYRASNSRTSAMLAIREDSKRFYDLLHYMKCFKNSESLSEHDVDVLRMILTNRAEREKASDHPYEMILKGISNTNIQMKGGKMSASKGGNSA